jgi:cell division protease FtsH
MYNAKEKDDKSFTCVVITKEAFPKVLSMRIRDFEKRFSSKDALAVYGPFASLTQLREALKIIRKLFPYRDRCEIGQSKPCFNAQIHLCPGVCVGAITEEDYKKNITNIRKLFGGKKTEIKKSLEKDMKEYAKKHLFEKAASVRNTLFVLDHIKDISLIKEDEILSFKETDYRIEAYDVAHISGTSRVGVMVVIEGKEEAKEELVEIIEFLKDPAKFQKLGGRIPKGVLLYGAPGTGKTMLAKAVAGEANVPFFSASGSEFVEMFVGVGAARVRDLFEQGKKNAPCLLFVDELDAVGRHRFAGIGGGHDEREQTLNQILVEMDGFESREGVILIAATNRPDVLDPALLRPGRFDRHIAVPAPDLRGREEILKVHGQKIKSSPNVNWNIIARRTPGFVGADLANVVNESALLAARENAQVVEMSHMEKAIDRVMAGPERKSRLLSDHERKVVSYHESGHALVAKLTPGADPVHKISIVSRGMALGYTLQLPLEDKHLTSKTELYNRLLVLMGGRAAEKLVFNEITTGAHDDLTKATSLATKMVCEFGMSDALGPITYKKPESEVFLGRDIASDRGYSEQTAQEIDAEIKRILTQAMTHVNDLLSKNRDKLETLAKALMEKENLNADEVNQLVGLPTTPPGNALPA